MRAMVLCAGLGTRLRPLTTLWPKPAMPLFGRPLLRYALSSLSQLGVREVAINTHHLPEVMEAVARAEASRAGFSLEVSHEAGAIQGTGGGIRGLSSFLSGGSSVVLNGDVLFAVDLRPIVEAHEASKADATMVLLPMPEGETYNAVELDAHRHVRRIAGQGPGGEKLSGWHFTGVHVLSPRVFDFMAPEGPIDINRDVYVKLIEAGGVVRGHVVTETDVYWSDLGTPQRYAATHRDVLFGQVPMVRFADASPFVGMLRHGLSAWAHPSARLGDARVTGPAWFGERVVLGQGVRIGAAVSLGAGVRVGDGAHLNRCAVLDGAEVEGGRLYEDVILAPRGVRVPMTGA
ncbi:MAG: NDP-sugar synthase [Myxococcaceae bacterium]|jgi:mannose-1-phosphate guanylyltransferase|nr:NDP-sugar synthase [Myxococcaceae bacterium]MCA3014703.1 NDP-sugar synthase [Myxococcaceae bacterium]